jgi:hypothetical protein
MERFEPRQCRSQSAYHVQFDSWRVLLKLDPQEIGILCIILQLENVLC